MKMKHTLYFFIILLILPFAAAFAQEADNSEAPENEEGILFSCGTERWAVKTCYDADTVNINFNLIVPSSVAYQRGLPTPTLPPQGDNTTRLASEDTVYSLDCNLIETKVESDSDYHVVISTLGNASETMDAEVVNPGCPNIANTSRYKALSTLFTWYRNWVGIPGSYKPINVPVHIVGVGFYDFLHGSTGAAPQGREIHPVLSMTILTTPVELSSFILTVVDNSVKLEWKTASEINNNHFEIERRDISPYWVKIGEVKGAGTSVTPNEYFFLDKRLPSNGKYYYRLKQVDNNGEPKYSNEIVADVNFIPSVYSLENNFPNPFNPSTVIRYSLPFDSNVKLTVYNSLGQVVVNDLSSGFKKAGTYDINFNAYSLNSGIYFYTIRANSTDRVHSFTYTKKMMLMK
jgi:Secretion system C-terminal sorting domain